MNLEQWVEALLAKKEQIAIKALELIHQQQPHLQNSFKNPDNSKSIRDLKYHLDYLAEAVTNSSSELFLDYIDWVRTILNNIGLSDVDIKENLKNLQKAIITILGEESAAIFQEYFEAACQRLEEVVSKPTTFLEKDDSLGLLAKTYLDFLLRGDRRGASKLILKAVEEGQQIKDIYLEVFEPVQKEIGRLWQINQINVAQEHFASAVTQFIMAQLYPQIFSGERINRTMIAASIGNELHEIGIRMVADFFEMEGWNTYYLGANVPQNSFLQEIKNKKPNIVAISVTISFNLQNISALIQKIRKIDPNVKIMVGGYPFLVDTKLWEKVGADASAQNAQEALKLAEKLVV